MSTGEVTNDLPSNADPAQQDIDIARAVFREEMDGISQVEKLIDHNFHRAVEAIVSCKGRLAVLGVGKSGLIGKKIAATFTSTGTPAFYIHPVEAAHGDLGLVQADDVIIFISKSGMSDEFKVLQPEFTRLGVPIIALTGKLDSHLARSADIVLNTAVSHEAGTRDLAPTTSATVALVMGDALACALMKRRNFKVEDFARFHPSGILGKRLTLRVHDLMRSGNRVPLVAHDTPFNESLFEMMDKAVGCVGIVDKAQRLVGIITDGDLKRILVRDKNALSTPVGDLMTPNPKTVRADVLASDALSQMELNESGPLSQYFIVDEDGKPIGLLHIHDILKAGFGGE